MTDILHGGTSVSFSIGHSNQATSFPVYRHCRYIYIYKT